MKDEKNFCEKCGSELSKNSNFCSNCGNVLKGEIQDIKDEKECVYCKTQIDKNAQICPMCHKRQPMGLKTRLNFFEIIIILIIAWLVFTNIIYPMIRVSID